MIFRKLLIHHYVLKQSKETIFISDSIGNHCCLQIVYSSFVDLLPKEVREDDPSLQKPSEDEIKEVSDMAMGYFYMVLFSLRKLKKPGKHLKLLLHRKSHPLYLFNMPRNKHLLNIFVIHLRNKERSSIPVPNNVLFKWLKCKKIQWNHLDSSTKSEDLPFLGYAKSDLFL